MAFSSPFIRMNKCINVIDLSLQLVEMQKWSTEPDHVCASGIQLTLLLFLDGFTAKKSTPVLPTVHIEVRLVASMSYSAFSKVKEVKIGHWLHISTLYNPKRTWFCISWFPSLIDSTRD